MKTTMMLAAGTVGAGLLAFAPPPAAGQEARIYVSPAGDDAWSGRSPDPDQARGDGPKATPAAGLAAARADGVKTIVLRAGTYRLSAPLQLTRADNGRRIIAQPGETPVLSGGEVIRGLSPRGDGVFQAPLDHEPGLDVTLEGERLAPASWPDEGWAGAVEVAEGPRKCCLRAQGRPQGRTLNPAWAKPGVRVQAFDRERLADDIAPLKEIEPTSGTVRLAGEGHYPYRGGSNFRLLGHPDFLKRPGQFAWDADGRRLLVRPKDGRHPREDAVVVARFGPLIRLDQTEGVTLSGLAFADVPWDKSAVRVEGGAGDRVEGNHFHDVGLAVELVGAHDARIESNRMERLGQTGIEIQPTASGNRILANRIHDVGEVTFAGAGISVSGASHTLIAHNEIRRAARYGVSIKNWDAHTLNTDTVIAYNRVLDTGRQGADNGGIEMLGRSGADTRAVIRFNDIRHTGGVATDAGGRWLTRYKGFGIYLDDMTSGVQVEGNVLVDTGWAGIFIHGGHGNRVTNQIAVLTEARDRFLRVESVPQAGAAGRPRDNLARHNLICAPSGVDHVVESLSGGDTAVTEMVVDRAACGIKKGQRLDDDHAPVTDEVLRAQGFQPPPWSRIGPEGYRLENAGRE